MITVAYEFGLVFAEGIWNIHILWLYKVEARLYIRQKTMGIYESMLLVTCSTGNSHLKFKTS
jgi:hypothetical protein